MVALIPRFRSTGFLIRPTSRSRSKFCMFRAPICRRSAYSATTPTLSGLITSVTMGSPVSLPARASSFSPSSFNPWKVWGPVRGLNAPPRSRLAPDFFTARAVFMI